MILTVTLIQPWQDLPVGLRVTLSANTAVRLIKEGIARV